LDNRNSLICRNWSMFRDTSCEFQYILSVH